MASPFQVFRKHQKFLIATLCLMAIIAFVFLDLIGKAVGTAKMTNPVVVTTKKYGDLKRSDVEYLRERRRRLLAFLRGVAGAVSEGDQLAFLTKDRFQIGPLRLGDPSPEAAVDQWLLVQHAKELGMVVSDDNVTRYLHELADNRLNKADFQKLYAQFHLNENVIYDTLHDAILAANVMGLFEIGLEGTTPGQRWDYYQRLYRKLDLEVAPVEVAQFVKQIDDPGDAELQAFFEEHKHRFPLAGSPEPGFKIPRRVSIEYVKAEFEQFAEPEAISDEEIEAHYQENRDEYRRVRLPSLDLDEPWSPETGTTEPSETKPEGDPQETPPAAQPSEPAAEPATEPATEPTTEPAVEPTVESATEPAVEPSEAKPAPQPAEEPEAKTSRTGAASPFRFVSMTQEETEQPKTDVDDDYKPLDEVKDEIRTLLARRKAAERMQTALNTIQSAMKKHQKAIIDYEASEDRKNQTPPEVDLEPLAKAAKLKFVRTGLVTVAELEETDIGLSGDGVSESFAQKVFSSLPVYLPDDSWDMDANQYLFWKTNETEQRVPEFTDEGIRDKVLAAWRLVKARERAQAHAEALAEEARKSSLSLEDSIGKRDGVTVARTGEFTWITSETTAATQYRAQWRFGTVENVDQAGPDFMKAAYALKKGEIDTAMNMPQTVVYVMRLVETTPSEKYLVAMFETDPYHKYRAIADAEKHEVFSAWIRHLRDQAGLEWKERLETPE